MNQRAIIVLLLALVAWTAPRCQRSPSTMDAKDEFRWNDKDIQELGPEDSLAQTKKLSAHDRDLLIRAIMGELQPGAEGTRSASKAQFRAVAETTRIRLFDLNGDGQPEIIAQASGDDAGCSPTGNCPIWVFRRDGNRFSVILERDAIQTFTIQPTSTGSYRDLVLGQHGSAFEQELHVYRWNGKRYEESACYDARWQRLVDDEWQETKDPVITPCGQQP